MKKSVILFVVILSIIMSSQVGAQYGSDILPVYDSEDTVTFIVEMEGNPVLPALQLSHKNKNGRKNQDADIYRSALLKSHKKATDALNRELSDDITPKYTYTELFNGFAMEAKYGEMDMIRAAEGVKEVYVSSKRKMDFQMSNAPSMTHSLPSETLGYTGSGQVIAVLDSEFDVKHVAFSKAPQNPKYTKQDIASILSGSEFNASNEVNRVYESAKIPFRYDYGEGDSDTFATVDVHGTHVAGIAAGNSLDGDFCGVAPDAQLVLMKISDAEGYMSDAAVAAAMDDAAKLGVCVINCSFGTNYQAVDAFNPVLAKCYANAYHAGIFVSVSAGNAGRGFPNAWTETTHIDDSATGTPKALDTTITVGSVDNTIANVDISEITLGDGNVLDAAPLYDGTACLTAGEYIYCKLGYPEDFEGLDVKGKIAVVDRGEITFTEKSDHAKTAGAVGMICINNEDTYVLTDALSLPSVCVTSSLGNLLKNAEVTTILSVTPFAPKPFEYDLTISNFSSYGTTEALGLKPDISAPGGGIYSSLPGDQYGFESGTSMSTPHVSGIVAIISQYLEDTGYIASVSEGVDFIGNLMMSSADVVYMISEDEETKVPFSPRVQGAGMVNTANAIKTPVILYADSGKTKLELGDRLTDTIEITFTAQNLTENDVVYDKISAVTLTDDYVSDNGIHYISGTKLLKSEWIADFDTVVVPANSSVTVSAKIKLDRDELYENSLIFRNGFYIDGFIRMENTTEDIVSVGMPFMGFCGNWTQAPVFDTTMYDEGGSRLIYEEKGNQGTFLFSNLQDQQVMLGYNQLSNTCDADAIAISPDGDGLHDILGLQFTAMRSIKDLKIMITDEDGNVLCVQNTDVVSKFISYQEIIKIPENIADGTYFVTAEGYMNYDTENSIKHSISIPFKVDRQKSLIKGCKLDGNVLTIDVCDDSGIFYVGFIDAVTGNLYETYYDSYVAEDQMVCEFKDNEAPDLSNIKVEILDNAMNLSSCFLGGFGGKIGAHISEISADEASYSITFNLNGEDEFSGASLILAFYDEKGSLIHTNIMQNQSVSSSAYTFEGNFDASTADKCKLFIWNGTEKVMPLDTAKIFDVKMEIGS